VEAYSLRPAFIVGPAVYIPLTILQQHMLPIIATIPLLTGEPDQFASHLHVWIWPRAESNTETGGAQQLIGSRRDQPGAGSPRFFGSSFSAVADAASYRVPTPSKNALLSCFPPPARPGTFIASQFDSNPPKTREGETVWTTQKMRPGQDFRDGRELVACTTCGSIARIMLR
jgi:hypothetical protein